MAALKTVAPPKAIEASCCRQQRQLEVYKDVQLDTAERSSYHQKVPVGVAYMLVEVSSRTSNQYYDPFSDASSHNFKPRNFHVRNSCSFHQGMTVALAD